MVDAFARMSNITYFLLGCSSIFRQHGPKDPRVHPGHTSQAPANQREPSPLCAPVLHLDVTTPPLRAFVPTYSVFTCTRTHTHTPSRPPSQVLHHRARERGARLHCHQVVRRAVPRLWTSGRPPSNTHWRAPTNPPLFRCRKPIRTCPWAHPWKSLRSH